MQSAWREGHALFDNRIHSMSLKQLKCGISLHVINITLHCEHVIYTAELLNLTCLELKQLFLSYQCFVYHRRISGLFQSVHRNQGHGAGTQNKASFLWGTLRKLFCRCSITLIIWIEMLLQKGLGHSAFLKIIFHYNVSHLSIHDIDFTGILNNEKYV